jgi:hypothetical protein
MITSSLIYQAGLARPNSGHRPADKPCGHSRHLGTCGACQRAQLARLAAHNAAAAAAGRQFARAQRRERLNEDQADRFGQQTPHGQATT